MTTTTRGRSIQERIDALHGPTKPPRSTGTKEATVEKRSRVIAELSPFVLPASQHSASHGASSPMSTREGDGDGKVNPLTKKSLEYLKKQKELVDDEMDQIDKRRKTVFSKQREVWGVYRHGLETISKLTDLRDAPDALLPGNF